MPQDNQLTPHFALSEFTVSGWAERNGVRNVPNAAQTENLRRLANLLEVVRSYLVGAPITISSGFRNAQVNAAVGGASHSAHLDGRAADFIAPRFGTPRDICQQIVTADITFDQLIFEGSWVHLSIAVAVERPRRQVLTAIFERGQPARYIKGIV